MSKHHLGNGITAVPNKPKYMATLISIYRGIKIVILDRNDKDRLTIVIL